MNPITFTNPAYKQTASSSSLTHAPAMGWSVIWWEHSRAFGVTNCCMRKARRMRDSAANRWVLPACRTPSRSLSLGITISVSTDPRSASIASRACHSRTFVSVDHARSSPAHPQTPAGHPADPRACPSDDLSVCKILFSTPWKMHTTAAHSHDLSPRLEISLSRPVSSSPFIPALPAQTSHKARLTTTQSTVISPSVSCPDTSRER